MKRIIYLLLIIFIIITGNFKKESNTDELNKKNDIVFQNESQISISPNAKYKAEAYGTNTSITAGGLYPYEGIRIIDLDNSKTIWEMSPGYYIVGFKWSPNSRYVGIYYKARIYGSSIVFDIQEQKELSLPNLNEIASLYGKEPKQYRPDAYFKVVEWLNEETIIIDFEFITESEDTFNGKYTFNINTNAINII